jgi:hypothetical protein
MCSAVSGGDVTAIFHGESLRHQAGRNFSGRARIFFALPVKKILTARSKIDRWGGQNRAANENFRP